jgi:hypothetical protein
MVIIDLMEKVANEDYQMVYQEAKNSKICIICKKPADTFRDRSARLEYSISAICQICQDNLFK